MSLTSSVALGQPHVPSTSWKSGSQAVSPPGLCAVSVASCQPDLGSGSIHYDPMRSLRARPLSHFHYYLAV